MQRDICLRWVKSQSPMDSYIQVRPVSCPPQGHKAELGSKNTYA